MLKENINDNSFINLKKFAESQGGVADSFRGTFDVLVVSSSKKYLFQNVEIHISYMYSYMDYRVEIMWEDDITQPPYKDLGLHGYYSSNYQNFILKKDSLVFWDGEKEITVFKST